MLRRVRASLRLHLASHFRLAFSWRNFNVPRRYAFAYSSRRFEYMYRARNELVSPMLLQAKQGLPAVGQLTSNNA